MLINPKTQTTIARWASRNVILAQAILSFSEISRLVIAFYLGTVLMRKVGVNELLLLTILAFSVIYALLKSDVRRHHYKAYLIRTWAVMAITWFMSFSLGGFLSAQNDSSPSVFAGDVYTGPQSGLVGKLSEKSEVKMTFRKDRYKPKTGMGKRKLMYGLLFLLSLGLTIGGALLTCTLTCSGLWYFALLAGITTLGIFAGGIYFLTRIFRRGYQRKYSRLRKDQKREEWRKFFLIWGFTSLGLFAGLLLFTLVL